MLALLQLDEMLPRRSDQNGECVIVRGNRHVAVQRALRVQVKQLPIQIVESDEPLGLAAARIKAGYKLSVADAWIAATAQRLGAILVHKDPEFKHLAKLVRLRDLPWKAAHG